MRRWVWSGVVAVGLLVTGTLTSLPAGAAASSGPGSGYWLAASDGGVFAYGGAPFYGSIADLHLAAPIVAIASPSNGTGYWLVGADGGVFAFGNVPFFGSLPTLGADAERTHRVDRRRRAMAAATGCWVRTGLCMRSAT